MKRPARSTITSLAAMIVAASVAFTAGTIVNASSSPEPVTFYACLRNGMLRRAGTVQPTCGQRSELISWNQTGPAGPAGSPGPPGPQGEQGPGSEAYVFSIESIGDAPPSNPFDIPSVAWGHSACLYDGYMNGAFSTGSSNCVGLFPDATTIMLEAQNHSGLDVAWGGAAAACGSDQFCEVTMSGDTHVTVTFSPAPP